MAEISSNDKKLHKACCDGDPFALEKLLQRQANPNTHIEGESALHCAMMRDHFDCMKLLLKYDCDILSKNEVTGNSFLFDSIEQNLQKSELALSNHLKKLSAKANGETKAIIKRELGAATLQRLEKKATQKQVKAVEEGEQSLARKRRNSLKNSNSTTSSPSVVAASSSSSSPKRLPSNLGRKNSIGEIRKHDQNSPSHQNTGLIKARVLKQKQASVRKLGSKLDISSSDQLSPSIESLSSRPSSSSNSTGLTVETITSIHQKDISIINEFQQDENVIKEDKSIIQVDKQHKETIIPVQIEEATSVGEYKQEEQEEEKEEEKVKSLETTQTTSPKLVRRKSMTDKLRAAQLFEDFRMMREPDLNQGDILEGKCDWLSISESSPATSERKKTLSECWEERYFILDKKTLQFDVVTLEGNVELEHILPYQLEFRGFLCKAVYKKTGLLGRKHRVDLVSIDHSDERTRRNPLGVAEGFPIPTSETKNLMPLSSLVFTDKTLAQKLVAMINHDDDDKDDENTSIERKENEMESPKSLEPIQTPTQLEQEKKEKTIQLVQNNALFKSKNEAKQEKSENILMFKEDVESQLLKQNDNESNEKQMNTKKIVNNNEIINQTRNNVVNSGDGVVNQALSNKKQKHHEKNRNSAHHSEFLEQYEQRKNEKDARKAKTTQAANEAALRARSSALEQEDSVRKEKEEFKQEEDEEDGDGDDRVYHAIPPAAPKSCCLVM